MTKTRVFLPGLVIAVLVGGIIGTVLTVAIDLSQRPVMVTLGVVVGAVAAAMVGFATALLVSSARRTGDDPRPRLLVEPVETLDAAAVPDGTELAGGPGSAAPQPRTGPPASASPVVDVVESTQQHQVELADEPAAPAGPGTSSELPEPAAVLPEPAVVLPDPVAPPFPESDRPDGPVLLSPAVRLVGRAITRDAAIDEAGGLLVASGAVEEGYLAALHARERVTSTFMGGELAIPHGTADAAGLIRRPAVAVVRYPEPVGWSGNPVRFVIVIAAAGDEYLRLVSAVAEVFLDERAVERLEQATTAAEVVRVLAAVNR